MQSQVMLSATSPQSRAGAGCCSWHGLWERGMWDFTGCSCGEHWGESPALEVGGKAIFDPAETELSSCKATTGLEGEEAHSLLLPPAFPPSPSQVGQGGVG